MVMNKTPIIVLAWIRNTYMKVFVASGYYEIATPFFGTEYTVNHIYMMYIHEESMRDRGEANVPGAR